MKALLSTLVLFLTAASLWSAPQPAANEKHWTKIDLPKKPGNDPIGVEPEGGFFAQVLPNPGEYTFSIYAKDQLDSILAIYSTKQSRIALERPLARVRLQAKKPGETQFRVRVGMKRDADGALSIFAEDREFHRPMTVTQVSESDVRQAKLKAPSAPHSPSKPAEIAQGPSTTKQAPDSGIKQSIGVRGPSGIFKPVLNRGAAPDTTGTTTFYTNFPAALTADVRLFAGDSPFIEGTKPFGRYLISGIKPTPGHKNIVEFELKVGPRGKIISTATQMSPKTTLVVEEYSRAALERLQASGQLGQTPPATEAEVPGRIPSNPLR
jgi:hypothetical protein